MSGLPPNHQFPPNNMQWQVSIDRTGSTGTSSDPRFPAYTTMRDGAPPAYQPPPGPPRQWTAESKQTWEANGSPNEYAPPKGPPSGRGDSHRRHSPALPNSQNGEYGPSPTRSQDAADYQPPHGPPPHRSQGPSDYNPPPGPPPSHNKADPEEAEPPPYDPWLAVPDNALLPPPPSFQEDKSPGANATYDDAARAHGWCRANPLWQPRAQNAQTLQRIQTGDIYLTTPPNTRHVTLQRSGVGRTHVRTTPKCTDTIFLSDIPVLPASIAGRPRTVYFELHVLAMGRPNSEVEAGIALGFVAPPYPAWRLPGWHRGSLGVHGDDGRRYVDDSFGGRDFTAPFQKGDTVGIGLILDMQGGVDVMFTRNGKRDGGWNLYEERDGEVEEGEVEGLEGRHDLLAAVGVFGDVEFEVRCASDAWQFRP